MIWQPTRILRQMGEEPVGTSASPVQVLTDAGPAFLKALGNDEGPHALACDWIGTHIAALLGLPTFAMAILQLPFPILRPDSSPLAAGPAFVVQKMEGGPWDGTAEALQRLENPDALAGLVVLDCLIRNSDRFVPDERDPVQGRRNVRNVFLAPSERRRYHLVIAMDHTHCLGRRSGGAIPIRPDTIDAIQDERLLGLFPEFTPLVTREALARWMPALQRIEPAAVAPIMSALPAEWDLDRVRQERVTGLLTRRAAWLCEHLPSLLAGRCGWTTELDFS